MSTNQFFSTETENALSVQEGMISFQIIDYQDTNIKEEEDSPTAGENEKYVVRLFGRTSANDPEFPDKSVCLTLTGFEPYFYLRVPRNFVERKLEKWLEEARNIRGITIGKKFLSKDFDGFRANKPSCFIKLSAASSKTIRRTVQTITGAMKMESSFWIKKGSSQSEIIQECKKQFGNDKGIAEKTVDDSNEGDSACVRVRFRTLFDYREAMKRLYKRSSCPPALDSLEDQLRTDPEIRLYESNIDPILRVMHSIGIKGCSWVQVSPKSMSTRQTISLCDLEGVMNWSHLKPDTVKEENAEQARFRVMSYDIETMSTDENGGFPQASREGDAVIQIGVTLNYYQHQDCYKKILLSYKTCDPIDGVDVRSFDSEEDLLMEFVRILRTEDPDIITGYNIFGFDNVYLRDRAARHGIKEDFSKWSRINEESRFREKRLSSSALGDNRLFYYESPGRVQVDLFKVIQRDHNLPSYKLDYVSSHFNQNTMTDIKDNTFTTKGTSGLEPGGFFSLKVVENDSCGVEDDLPEKFQVTDIVGNTVHFRGGPIHLDPNVSEVRWCMAKDDLPARKIFDYWPIDSHHRAIVGKYCIKDCVLVNFLMEKLDVLSNNMGMSNVCFIPLPWVFLRGQGIKGLSLVSEKCRREGYLIPTIKKDDFLNEIYKDEGQEKHPFGDADSECSYDGCGVKGRLVEYDEKSVVVCQACSRIQYSTAYQGARVFDPKSGIYWDPIAVLDYASLYPRSMIAKNISWETLVEDPRLLDTPGYIFHRVVYFDTGFLQKEVECYFAQPTDGSYGILGQILIDLLDQRAATRKRLKKETNPFKKGVLDGLQLAYKVTCNSCYGITGAITSALYKKSLAACTTATGVFQLERAKKFVEEEFVQLLPTDHWAKSVIHPEVVYGDTDSVFVNWGLPKDMETREKRVRSIQLGELASELVKPLLDKPQDLEYEKVFHPWVVLTKKRYAGLKYETDPDKYKFTHMGIILKRRDSCLMVKKVCGGILHRMLTESSPEKVVEFVQNMLEDIVAGRYDIKCFVTSKRLKSHYKAPDSLAHVVLAKRMTERDPGTAPQSGDRLSYVTVYKPEHLDAKKVLQAEKIEEVSYVVENKLQVDYLFYITNQIMIPACQFMSLIVKNPEKTIFKSLIERVTRRRRIEKTKSIKNRFTEYFKVKNTP